jgi:hypothetical protein
MSEHIFSDTIRSIDKASGVDSGVKPGSISWWCFTCARATSSEAGTCRSTVLSIVHGLSGDYLVIVILTFPGAPLVLYLLFPALTTTNCAVRISKGYFPMHGGSEAAE